MPIINKLFSITQIKIHQQFFDFKFIKFILLFLSQLRLNNGISKLIGISIYLFKFVFVVIVFLLLLVV